MSDAEQTDETKPAPDDAFAALGLRPELLATLAALGYEEPTPIQREAIPVMLAGQDVLGQAATGTGKTGAFALPLLQLLEPGRQTRPIGLVLVPTRELAVQVSEAMHTYGRGLGAAVVPIYGGQPIGRQLHALRAGVDVVVATPGRALDHIARGTLVLEHVRVVVLDEADEMLDMGFAEDIDAILDATPPERQTVLFSATMPPRIDAIAGRHLRTPRRIQIGRAPLRADEAPLVRQQAYVVHRSHKPAALGRILDIEAPAAAIVFCRTRTEVDQLTETMNGRGYRAEALHGGMDQEQRDRVMGRLRSGSVELLVATDVAARGLDVEQLTHVVNYDVPSAPEAYVHRIGRVGRAGREGTAITLAEPREQRLLDGIERITRQTIEIRRMPTVADLRARQAEATTASIRAALAEDDRLRYGAILDALEDEADLRDVALAAVKLVHEASGANEEEPEIPDAFRPRTPPRRDGDGDGKRPARPRSSGGGRDGDRARLYIGLGRKDGIRPHDLVGAIANEVGLPGSDIGPIKVAERFSVVGIPTGALPGALEAMKHTVIRGKRAAVRRYTDPVDSSRSRPPG